MSFFFCSKVDIGTFILLKVTKCCLHLFIYFLEPWQGIFNCVTIGTVGGVAQW